jgi:hypothetical protein
MTAKHMTATPSKLLKMPGRKPGIKSDINVRFLTERDYLAIRNAARNQHVTANLFITQAALYAARHPEIAEFALRPALPPAKPKQRA